MLKINKKLSHKGFSLIELMVAVAILAIAVFGIFHAYSVGFMGMADARDRTVATNYGREAMEDIKNKDFDKIITQSRQFIPGTKFEREVIVQESTNLKKVTTRVYWKDRNGNTKMVEADMVLHFIETTAGAATKIILYANPYNVLTSDNTDTNDVYKNRSIITAVVKDEKGNTVTAYNDEITFSITVGNAYGSFQNNSDTYTVSANKGIATATFTASSEGEVTITASSGALTEDSVVIKITNPEEPVKINLTADPVFMPTGSISKITATIVNAAGGTVEIFKEITFSVSGPGNLSTPTTLTTVDGDGNPTGIATITLTSDGTPGTITVTASSTDLEPGVVDVITGGKIYLSASLIEVPKNETSTITVTTRDVNGALINYNGTIKFKVVGSNDGSGYLSPSSITFSEGSSSGTVTFTATSSEGTVNITAYDSAPDILTDSDVLTLTTTGELVPHHIEVYAIPSSIPAGGTETSVITAKVKDINEVTITSYTGSVTFTTTAGTFPGNVTSFETTFVDGIATAVLTSTIEADTATIKVCSPLASNCEIWGETQVGFYIGPDHILLSAVPQKLSAGGQSCIVTAKIVDYYGNLIGDYNEDITFIISPWPPGPIKFSKATTYILTQKVKKGIATVKLVSGSEVGTGVIDAYSGNVSGTLNIPVGINLSLVENSVIYEYSSEENIGTVSFDVEVEGAEFLLEEMQVSWESPINETLIKIKVEETPIYYIGDDLIDPIGSIVYSGDSNNRIADVNVTDIALIKDISTTITMYFNANMSGKTFEVIFNPNSGNYLVPITEPT